MKANLVKWAMKLLLISALIFLFGMIKVEAATLSVGSVKAQSGETITISIDLANSPSTRISSMNFNLLYDSNQISFDKAQAGQILSDAGKSLSTSTPAPGQLNVIIFGLNQNSIANGTLVQVIFHINTTAKTGNVALKLKNAVASSPQAKSVPLKLKGGKITVKGARRGK